jgi:pimeloyl-ACP methyl ester carboxylesterase
MALRTVNPEMSTRTSLCPLDGVLGWVRSCHPSECPIPSLGVAARTRTRYARCGDEDIAYQVLGDGSLDLLLFLGVFIPIDCIDEEPSMARFQRRLATFARVLRFDVRGVGLSDRGSPLAPPTQAQWVEDAVAVLDAVGSERAAVLAPFQASPMGLMLAATHPERVKSLILVNAFARVIQAPDYPQGLPRNVVDSMRPLAVEPDAVEQGHDILEFLAPSTVGDEAFRSWWDRSGNLGATPAMARAMATVGYETDVREFLPRIGTHTLIIQRKDSALVSVKHGRYLRDHIAGAKYIELPGSDVLYWVGDTKAMLDEIEEFLTGTRGGQGTERVLSTVLVTDIVASTAQAVQVGDARWRDLLDRHDQSVRAQIELYRGREVKSVGDGFVAMTSPGWRSTSVPECRPWQVPVRCWSRQPSKTSLPDRASNSKRVGSMNSRVSQVHGSYLP